MTAKRNTETIKNKSTIDTRYVNKDLQIKEMMLYISVILIIFFSITIYLYFSQNKQNLMNYIFQRNNISKAFFITRVP